MAQWRYFLSGTREDAVAKTSILVWKVVGQAADHGVLEHPVQPPPGADSIPLF